MHFWLGLVLGIQDNTEATNTDCYEAAIDFAQVIHKFTEANQEDFELSRKKKGVSGSLPGYYMELIRENVDMASGLANLYA